MNNDFEKIFDFLHRIEKLKSTFRYTRTASGGRESSAAHSWRLSLMVFMVADVLKFDLNVLQAVKIALVHDLAEAITGDIDAIQIAEHKISKEEKQKLEIKAMKKIKATLPQKMGEEIYGLWQEYEEAKTQEAKFVKALDKLETLTQLVEAGYKTYDKPEFIAGYADQAVKNFSELSPLLKVIKEQLKKEFQKGKLPW